MTTLQEAVQFLLDNGYMAIIKKRYIVTAKFNKEMTGVHAGLTLLVGNYPAVIEPSVPKQISWPDLYKQFILEAKVPARIINSRGEPYATNIYSEPGMKAFRKALEKESMTYQLMVECTQLYYSSSIGMKVAIGRFMEEGMWRTYYQELLEMKQLGKEVKPNTDGSYTKWKVG
jgi:hypothetical protein